MAQQTFLGVDTAFIAGQKLTAGNINKLRGFITFLVKDGTESTIGGTSPLRLDMTLGLVGIGADAVATYILRSVGKTRLDTSATSDERALTIFGSSHATSEIAAIDFFSAAGAVKFSLGQDLNNTGAYDFGIEDTTSMRFYIDSSGRLGLGAGATTAGSTVRVFSGTSATANGILIDPSTHATSRRATITYDAWGVGQDSAQSGVKNFYFNNGSDRLTIGTTGIVNVGTALEVAGVAAFVVPFNTPGTLTIGTGKARWTANRAMTIKSVELSINTSPQGLPVVVDVNKNGTTIFTTQANRPALKSTASVTSFLIGTGSKAFAVTAANTQGTAGAFVVSDVVKIMSRANSANFMIGTVTAFVTTTLTVNVTSTGGSGTLTDWNIFLSTELYANVAPTPAVTALASGDYITVDIDSVGTTVAGSDLVVQVEYE